MLNVLHIYIIASEIFSSKMYSEYAENVYNVERNFRLLKKNFEGLETRGIFPAKRCTRKAADADSFPSTSLTRSLFLIISLREKCTAMQMETDYGPKTAYCSRGCMGHNPWTLADSKRLVKK